MRRHLATGLASGLALCCLALVGGSASAEEVKDVRKLVVFGSEGGHLGVRLDEVDGQAVERLKLPEERGALVRKVESGTPAEKAGLAADDVIIRYQGQPVESATQLSRLVRETPAGRKVSLEVVRKGVTEKLTAVLDKRAGAPGPEPFHFEMPNMGGDMPDFEMPAMPPVHAGRDFQWRMAPFGGPRKLGIEFQPISGQLAKYFKLDAEEGVLVASVDEDGPAATGGVKAGDVLLKLAGKDIHSGSDLREALAETDPGREIPVTILRDGTRTELTVVVGGAKAEETDKPAKGAAEDDAKIKAKKVKPVKSI
jgi:serine protease Do